MADQVVTEKYAIYNDDCIEGMFQLPDESIHFSIYSPPFPTASGGLYHYTSSDRDPSNSRDYGEFLEHYDFVVTEIARLTKPGRMTAVHCMDTPAGNTGKGDFILDFPGDVIEQHIKCRNPHCQAPEWAKRKGLCGHGWFEHTARHVIWKEPLQVRNRTMAKKLAHKTIVEDSTNAGVAGADYLLIFRRKGTNQEPVTHEHGFTEYAGSLPIPAEALRFRGWTGDQIENKYSHVIWQRYASSIWDDIRIDNTLPFRGDPDDEDAEKHVHPLQLDVIERALQMYTNPKDVVLSPYLGCGSEVYGAVRAGRLGIGFELKDSYFAQAVLNLESVEDYQQAQELTLFDM